jgi:hypothetical protein
MHALFTGGTHDVAHTPPTAFSCLLSKQQAQAAMACRAAAVAPAGAAAGATVPARHHHYQGQEKVRSPAVCEYAECSPPPTPPPPPHTCRSMSFSGSFSRWSRILLDIVSCSLHRLARRGGRAKQHANTQAKSTLMQCCAHSAPRRPACMGLTTRNCNPCCCPHFCLAGLLNLGICTKRAAGAPVLQPQTAGQGFARMRRGTRMHTGLAPTTHQFLTTSCDSPNRGSSSFSKTWLKGPCPRSCVSPACTRDMTATP